MHDELYFNIFEESPIGIGVLNLHGKFVKTNRRLSEITEYTNYELSQLKFYDLTHPQDYEADVEAFKHCDSDGYEIVKRFITKSGKSIWVRVSVWPVYKEGKPIMVVNQAIPMLNGERAKLEKVGENKVEIRPTLTFYEFIQDNFKEVVGSLGVIFIACITALAGAGFLYHTASQAKEEAVQAKEAAIKLIQEFQHEPSLPNRGGASN